MTESFSLHCGVLLDSVLDPILLLVYTYSLALLLASHGVHGYFYANDWQIYLPIANTDETTAKVVALPSDVRTCTRGRKLKVNDSKTHIILIKDNWRANVTHDFW